MFLIFKRKVNLKLKALSPPFPSSPFFLTFTSHVYWHPLALFFLGAEPQVDRPQVPMSQKRQEPDTSFKNQTKPTFWRNIEKPSSRKHALLSIHEAQLFQHFPLIHTRLLLSQKEALWSPFQVWLQRQWHEITIFLILYFQWITSSFGWVLTLSSFSISWSHSLDQIINVTLVNHLFCTTMQSKYSCHGKVI